MSKSVLFLYNVTFQKNLMSRLCVLGIVLITLLACREDKAVEPEPESHPLLGAWQSSGRSGKYRIVHNG